MTVEDFQKQLEALSAEYRGRLPGRLADIEALWRGLVAGSVDAGRLKELQRELHTIAGSARTFGVAGVSEAAGAAEACLEPFCVRGALPGTAARSEFQRLLESLKQAIEASGATR